MTDQNGTRSRTRGPFLVPLVALGMVVLIFGAIVGISTFNLRQDLRGKVVQRYADIWAPLSKFHVEQGISDDLLGILDFEDTLVFSLMSAQEIEGALGVQVYDRWGEFLAGVPIGQDESPLSEASVQRLSAGAPWGVFWPEGSVNAPGASRDPEIELNIPIHGQNGGQPEYLARYFMDGRTVLEEFGVIDRNLSKQASLAFLGGTFLVSAVCVCSLWRLLKANAELAERAARLAKANAELAMVAKTSAIGAVASHLIHGLKNPLAGIRQHLSANGRDLDDDEWADARKATGRMQAMVNEVVDVLRNEAFDEMERLTGDEIAAYLRSKFESRANGKELDFGVWSEPGVSLSARDANIAKLIVSNLVDNAIDAVSSGGEVETRIGLQEDGVVFTIIDTGPGFSDVARSKLFAPVQSSKMAGAGIGLAISQQLARHLGAELELVRSSSSGSEIRLSVPIAHPLQSAS